MIIKYSLLIYLYFIYGSSHDIMAGLEYIIFIFVIEIEKNIYLFFSELFTKNKENENVT